jgi:hypothetical protein
MRYCLDASPAKKQLANISKCDKLQVADNGTRTAVAASQPGYAGTQGDNPKKVSCVAVPQTSLEAFDVFLVCRHTLTRLETLAQHVREGKEIMAASEFARWVRSSGLITIFDKCKQGEPHPINGRAVNEAVAKLLHLCEDAWKNHGGPVVTASGLDDINRKLDILAAQMAHVATVATKPHPRLPKAAKVPLRLIAGGPL